MHFRLRSFIRVSIDSKININSREVDLKAFLANISLGGVFVKPIGQVPVAIGTLYTLTFELPFSSSTNSIAVNAIALRSSVDGIAFRFIETDPQTLRLVFNYVYQEDGLVMG